MKKTLLATAIAGAMAASGAQAATVYNQDGTKLDIYGNIQLAVASFDEAERDEAGNLSSESTDSLFDNGSTFGFAAEHVIYDGLTGYLKLEFDDFQADEKKITGRDTGDQAYIGLKGNFGDVRLGSYDPLIDDWSQDWITNNELADVSDSTTDLGNAFDFLGIDGGDREGDKLTYTSPVFNGLQFALGTQYKGDGEDVNSNFKYDSSGRMERNASFFGGVKYTVGNLQLSAVYDDLETHSVEVGSNDIADFDAYSFAANYSMNALRLSFKYERTDIDFMDESGEIDRYGLGARYGYGPGDVYLAYQRVEADDDLAGVVANPNGFNPVSGQYEGDDSFNEVLGGVTYNISDAMYVFGEAGVYDRSGDDGDFIGTGVVYLF
ncbi:MULTISPECIES: porin [unclassified Halomonas]|uniref:porin n=1 Tax=unclassified Halomonas TaxID=2609666 RepID=UPI0006146772|nr:MULTISPECIES: porin [unclassified Halomonas]RAH38575.1 porin [Halomonas sp. SL1]